MTRWALGIVALATSAALTGCGGPASTTAKPAGTTPATPTTSAPSPAPSTLTAYAVVLFHDVLGMTDPAGVSHCDDRAGIHADVYTGAQIQLVDAHGKTVGAGTLKVATGADAPPKNVCAWNATFEQVPVGQGPYTAQVGPFRSEALTESDLATKRLVVEAK